MTKLCLSRKIFVATKDLFLRDKNDTSGSSCKSCVAANILLSRQKTGFVPIKLLFVAANILLSRQKTGFVPIKLLFVAANILLSRQKTGFVPIKLLFVATSILLSPKKTCFVATNTHLSRQARVCRDKTDSCGSSRQ